jgi:OmpA-OmpF porin, OOP family
MRFTPFFLVTVAAATALAWAQEEQLKDCNGCSDHAMVSRYPNSILVGHDRRAFERVMLADGPSLVGEDGEWLKPTTLTVEGKRTQLFYWEPEGRSALEIFLNYQDALRKSGMTQLFSCADDACGEPFAGQVLRMMRVDLENSLEARQGAGDAEHPHYLLAKMSREQGDVYAAVLVAELSTREPPRAAAVVIVAETKPLEKGMVVIDVPTLERQLLQDGKATIYAITFDFDQAKIKPESKVQLDQIAKLLADHADIKLSINGHTDNQGAPDYNHTLSQRRADAVVAALVAGYGVSAERLTAQGFGASTPLTGNDTEEGRAKNRRVELIKR